MKIEPHLVGCGFLMTALISASLPVSEAYYRPPAPAKHQSVDSRVYAMLVESGTADVLVLCGTPPDLSPARRVRGKSERGRAVYDLLRHEALRQQASLVSLLDRRGVAYRRFWSVNAVQVRVDRQLLEEVLAISEVTAVLANLSSSGLAAIPPLQPCEEPAPITAGPATVEWGVMRVGAPWAWEKGHLGQSVVVGNQDTGYDWDHPALQRAYRGYDVTTGAVDHNYSWHDSIHGDIGTPNSNPCGYDSPVPCDDHGHGTHTTGTMVGNDQDPGASDWPSSANNAIGVAPAAKWMGCRNMDQGDGTPATYIECFDWLMAPYPRGGDPLTEGDPTRAPDVINNSWYCPPQEGCLGPEIEPSLNAADAAGILVVASAGNDGARGCGSIRYPPAMYPRAFAVGATASTDLLASFSSRGPTAYGGTSRVAPAISAPGVAVRSSIPGTGYATWSGTSMAGPHVAGVAALLLSAEPSLRGQTEMLRAILTRTADPRVDTSCSGVAGGRPNNLYGWGIVNARAAIESLSLPATLGGTVSSAWLGAPLAGVTVTLRVPSAEVPVATTSTATTGAYSLMTGWGTYVVGVSHPHLGPVTSGPHYLVGGVTSDLDFALTSTIRADCNTDLRVDGGDVAAIILEIFDGDGNAPVDAPRGEMGGSPVGCDANGDGAIDAADVSCAILTVFNGAGACDIR